MPDSYPVLLFRSPAGGGAMPLTDPQALERAAGICRQMTVEYRARTEWLVVYGTTRSAEWPKEATDGD